MGSPAPSKSVARIILISCFFFFSCSNAFERTSKSRPGRLTEEPIHLLSKIQNTNSNLKTFKGIGSIHFGTGAQRQKARAAWVGAMNAKLRIEILSISGQPAASLANDGKWLYLHLHQKRRFHKKHSTGSNLKAFFSIPVESQDVVDLLAGRVPIRSHHQVSIVANPSQEGYILILSKRWRGEIERIYLDKEKSRIDKIEILGNQGSIAYRVHFEGRQIVDGFVIPASLDITNTQGDRLKIEIERFWTNVAVSPSMFVLNPPQG